MMKEKIINPNKNLKHLAKDKSCNPIASHSAKEIDAPEIYRLAYTYPYALLPMIDLSFAFDELKKILKNWFSNKRSQ